MQLIKVQIDGYKHLKNTCVHFNETDSVSPFREELPVRFFIGLNGSGKSVFLEGIWREWGDSQCLFLMDEPDVYLNEHWDIDFVAMIYRIYKGAKRNHEIVIATHSSLMLTDAFPNQLYYFQQKQGQVRCLNIRASTFGGSRNEIMENLFLTGNSVGTYSYETIGKILDETEDVQELENYLKQIGSGYLRLRILDKIQLLKG